MAHLGRQAHRVSFAGWATHREPILATINDEGAVWFDVIKGDPEPLFDLRCTGSLNLNGPGAVARAHFQDQVNLRPRRRAVEARTGANWGDGKQALDDKAFPTWPRNGMAEQIVQRFDAQQGMSQATISDIGLGRLDQPLAHIDMIGRQTADEQQIDQQPEIARHRRRRNCHARCQTRGIEEAALHMSEHLPKAFEHFGRDARAEHRNIALKIGANEAQANGETVGVAGGKQAVRKPTAQPQRHDA
jgi:hypothetical protein